MNKIYLCDYIGTCDENNVPTGHQIKVLNEYYSMLKNDLNIKFAIPKLYTNYIDGINIDECLFLNSNIRIGKLNIKYKIRNLYYKISSIKKILRNTEDSLVWFVNFDYFLGLVLLFLKINKDKKIVLTVFMDEYNNNLKIKDKIKTKLFKYALSKSYLIITSNKIIKEKYMNSIFIPDYYYHDDYKKYQNITKKSKVINVGTMGEVKDLEGLIELWKDIDYELEVNGRFLDKKRYERLRSNCSGNILIEDNNLSYDEYLSKIAESKFTVLPYKEDSYINRTSGVLLETIFLNSIPIAPKFLLEFNDIKGIDYELLKTEKSLQFNKSEIEEILQFNSLQIKNTYNINNIKNSIVNRLRRGAK